MRMHDAEDSAYDPGVFLKRAVTIAGRQEEPTIRGVFADQNDSCMAPTDQNEGKGRPMTRM